MKREDNQGYGSRREQSRPRGSPTGKEFEEILTTSIVAQKCQPGIVRGAKAFFVGQ